MECLARIGSSWPKEKKKSKKNLGAHKSKEINKRAKGKTNRLHDEK